MKKIIAVCTLTLVFSACAYNIYNPPEVKELDPVEMFGVKGRPLEGRLFMSSCQSNAFGSMETAQRTAFKNAAKKANQLGYKYFTVIEKNASTYKNLINYTVYDTVKADTHMSAYGSGGYAHGNVSTTMTVPSERTAQTQFQTYIFIFLLLDENELDGWDNIYSVAKYL